MPENSRSREVRGAEPSVWGPADTPPVNTCGKAAENELWVALFLSRPVVGMLD
ncbi:unnamed protein product, partial [marine sediment metagenome]